MHLGRRALMESTAGLAAGVLLGCRAGAAPAAVSITQRRVVRALPGMPTTDGAGVSLTRIIGQPQLRHLDPFVLLDQISSDDPRAYARGFPDHPHRGFETVTVMLDGRMRHKDSKGNHGLITGGGAQWMTAGRGIVHSEMPEQDQGLLHGFQLWVNLPAREKMCPPVYQDLGPERLAEASLSSGSSGSAGGRVRVIAGHASGLGGPVRERPTDPTLLTLSLTDDAPFDLDLPAGHTALAYVHGGSVLVGGDGAEIRVDEGTLAVLGAGNRLRLRAPDRASGVLVAAARPLGEPIVQRGPFVMSTEAEIEQAFADYRAGLL